MVHATLSNHYQVAVFPEGPHGIDRLTQDTSPYDLLMISYGLRSIPPELMPQQGAQFELSDVLPELVRRARALPPYKKSPILAVSDYPSHEQACGQAGATGFINPDQLTSHHVLEMIKRYLR
jgi:CheY-like chemotaxis protein